VPYAQLAQPLPGDFIAELITQRAWRTTPSASPLHDDSEVERLSLADPASLYTELAPLSTRTMDATWRAAWTSLRRAGFDMPLLQTQTIFRWDLGLTRARPGVEMPSLRSVYELGKPWVAANLVKAGIDRDLFLQARLIAGPGNGLLAANIGMAAQLLREKIEAAQASGDRYSGLWSGPLDHVMAARTAYALTDVETSYLMRLLENELDARRHPGQSVYGQRHVPTSVRVARLAAAYRSESYGAPYPCSDDGAFVPGVAATTLDDTTRPFCFADMIDRRVLAWYAATLRDDLAEKSGDPDIMSSHAGALIEAVERLRPAWLGTFVDASGDPSLDTDIVAATVVRQLAWSGRVSSDAQVALEELAVDRLCRGSSL
jgi:hypothetical protein